MSNANTKYKLNWTAPDGFLGTWEYETREEAEEMKRFMEKDGCSCTIRED